MKRSISLICVIYFIQSVFSGPILDLGYDEIKNNENVIESLIEAIEDKPTEIDNKTQQVLLNEHEKSSEIVHFNSKGESLEDEKTKLKTGAACKAPVQDLPKKASAQEEIKEKVHHNQHLEDNKLHSSSVEENAIRFDDQGNTKEEYKDTEENDDNHIEEKTKKRKNKQKKHKSESDEEDHRARINNKLNDKVVNKQLKIRDLANEDTDENSEEEDVPLITIPMVDILRQYQRMAQGFETSTEEYSDEKKKKIDHFEDPHLLGALEDISKERKKVKQERREGKKVKPAAQRLFGDVSKSEEEL